MELRNRLKKELKIDIRANELLGGKTVDFVINRIYDLLKINTIVEYDAEDSEDASESSDMETFLI